MFSLLLFSERFRSAAGTHERRARGRLFQGKLGFTKAIILLGNGCEEFSNIQGFGQIRFREVTSRVPSKISGEFWNGREFSASMRKPFHDNDLIYFDVICPHSPCDRRAKCLTKAEQRSPEFFRFEYPQPAHGAGYSRALGEFLRYCEAHRARSLALQPLHVATWIEALTREASAPP